MSNKLEIQFSIQYNNEDQARIVFSSIMPEIQEQRFERSKVSIVLKAQKMEININAHDINAAKATISSILRWISATTNVIKNISKQTYNN